MTFTVKIDCVNDAFSGMPEYEIARILHKIAAKLEAGITKGSAMDTNGNRVATFKLRGKI